ncbi:MAG: SseB family protein, partial [Lachnospiraceae bacterium]|nr:SseB family protein [Lachnospiraceae bacterium]
NNKYIKMAAERVINTNDVEDKIMLLRVIRKRIAEDGEAPMPMVDVNNAFGSVSLDDIKMGQNFTLGQEVRLRMETVKDEDGNEWFPLFTDMEELHKQPTANITINTSILVILQNALSSDRVQGVAINPFTEKLVLSKQMIEIILSEWEEDNKEKEE